MATCSILDCGRSVNARGVCKRHYYRLSRYGDPLGVPAVRTPRPPKPKAACSIDECDVVVYARGLCEKHYARVRRHGATHDKRAESQDPVLRFEARVDRTSTPDGCHLWTGPPNNAGYGYFKLDGRSIGAHVAACLLGGIEVPPGHEPDHLCRVPMCVRLDHLEVVTAAENKRRANALRWSNETT